MGKKRAALAGRAWSLFRLALLWARKGAAADWSLVPGYLRSLRTAAAAGRSDGVARYAERQFSFDETPIIHFKMHRPRSMRMPHIPCINPTADFEDDEYINSDGVFYGRGERMSWFRRGDDNMEVEGGEEEKIEVEKEEEGEGEEEGECIDVKAEEFIAKFYEQMKLQRQVSILQYHEMLPRSYC